MSYHSVATARPGPQTGRKQNAGTPGAPFLSALARSIGEHRRRQRDYAHLLELSDYLLEDIGVTRKQVVAALRWRLF
jgi:uncharacterized protein YjiS (DUF1127 family)